MFPLRTLALVVSSALLAGCAVGPDYHRPDAPFLNAIRHSLPSSREAPPDPPVLPSGGTASAIPC